MVTSAFLLHYRLANAGRSLSSIFCLFIISFHVSCMSCVSGSTRLSVPIVYFLNLCFVCGMHGPTVLCGSCPLVCAVTCVCVCLFVWLLVNSIYSWSTCTVCVDVCVHKSVCLCKHVCVCMCLVLVNVLFFFWAEAKWPRQNTGWPYGGEVHPYPITMCMLDVF